jgi:hypothetical protein
MSSRVHVSKLTVAPLINMVSNPRRSSFLLGEHACSQCCGGADKPPSRYIKPVNKVIGKENDKILEIARFLLDL